MRTSRNILLTAMAVATIVISAPAEAKPHHTAQRYSQPLDVAAIPAYPLEHAANSARWRHQAASRRVKRTTTTYRADDEDSRAELAPRGRQGGLETVDTAAGIRILVAPSFAPKIEGFIRDVVARGYHPRQIHCYASGGHVHNSLHYSGHACDFDQRGWGLTARPMYHVADLVAKWGLRDGAEFRDWGHIDDGPHLRRGSRAAYRESHPPFYGATADFHQRAHHHHRIRYARR